MLGAGLAWVAPAITYFDSEKCPFPVTTSEISWIASTYFALEVTTPIFVSTFSSKIGRKPLMITAAFLVSISWIIIIFAESASILIVSRIVLGMSAGCQDYTWSIYIGEVAGSKERGIFGSIMASAAIFGIAFMYLLSLFVSYLNLAIIPAVISAIAFVATFNMIETPQILLSFGDEDKAKSNLAWLRGTDTSNVKVEFEEIKLYLDEEKQNRRTFKHFLEHTSEYKIYIMCVVVFSFAQLSGNIVIVEYGAMIMDKYNTSLSGSNFTLIYGVLQVIFVNVASCLIETVGRRKLLIFGFGTSAILQSVAATLVYIHEYKILDEPYIPQAIAILIYVYGIIFIICLLPTVYVMKSELFPQELKCIGSVCATFCNSLSAFMALKFFITIWLSVGLYANFLIYAGISFISVIYIYTLIPETKGLSLAQIQKNIAARNNSTDVS